ncbi:hypothetical protein ACXQCJ_11975 [Staphylococcus argenteus]|uniref:Transposase n=2 Tax=Staphylococcus argenteus TaxID=985002 RepID=A0A7U7JVI4_9STAP|nr:transposase [Staphylococcus argenteus]MBE2152485.1 transposase [Staphylococcus argenteus]MDR7647252.1 transposase [Staphylococcus argenteus]MDT2976818.1 transposase [Staphylococcus argenteus]CRI14969.1 conserved hypothetical protein [Staphylococcus argenteus]CRI29370.1 conserved hypothetical protein [Staphylococcus argenteus]
MNSLIDNAESSTLSKTNTMRIDIVKLSVDDFIMTRVRRTYIKDFKLQMGKLYENGKSRNKVIREYDLTLSTNCRI